MTWAEGDLIADRYRVIEWRGGGQGRVYKALDSRHERVVALKVRAGGDLAEVGALLGLAPHPALPVARGDFFVDDDYVLVMDWVEGVDLGEELAAGRLPGPARSLLVAAQIAGALDHLHGAGVVHGDVKPGNVRLASSGHAVLIDLGLVEAGAGHGTPGFCAVEVAGGERPTAAADIYGLAATVFALLTGRPPHEGMPTAVAGLADGTWLTLSAALRTGLATDPSRRPPSAAALVESLLSAGAGSLPEGAATFVFTDVQGSTRLWEDHALAMSQVLADHDALIASVVTVHGGRLLKSKGEGDSTVSVFAEPGPAVLSALELQRAMVAVGEVGGAPLQVRMAVHSGVAEWRDGDYFGPTLNRAARLRGVAHGGQVLVSAAVHDAVAAALPEGVELVDLGMHRLRDLTRPEHVYQLAHADLREDFPPLLSLGNRRTNLPPQATSFVGRQDELERTAELLGLSRIVTLTGAGGSGKTRLSLQVGADALDQYPGGVWFAELAPVSEPSLVANTVASAMGLVVHPMFGAVAAIAEALRDGGPSLLILDNCEHLIDETAALTQAVIDSCPDARVLITSRERLRIAGEAAWPIPVMSLPEDANHAASSEAVHLFADRAAASRPGFVLGPDTVDDVIEICRRVEGIPLAIELAAARISALTPAQLAQRLADRFAVLTTGARMSVPRQRSLRATIDWSHSLLSEDEQVALRRLAVFRGGWTLEMAEEVASGDGLAVGGVLDALGGLVDKSLIRLDDDGRYRMLETVREYGLERLADVQEAETWAARHAAAVTEMAERVAGELQGGPSLPIAEVLRLADLEIDNIKAALAWSAEHDPEGAGRLFGQAGRYFVSRDRAVGSHWARRLAPLFPQMSRLTRCMALIVSAVIVGYGGDLETATTWLVEAEQIGREIESDEGLCYALLYQCALDRLSGRRADSVRHIEEALVVAERCQSGLLLGSALLWASWVASDGGDEATSEELLHRAEEEALACGDAVTLFQVYGDKAWFAEDPDEKEALARKSVALATELGDVLGVAMHVAGLAGVLWSNGKRREAISLMEGNVARGNLGHATQQAGWRAHLAWMYGAEHRAAEGWELLDPLLRPGATDDLTAVRVQWTAAQLRLELDDPVGAERFALEALRTLALLDPDNLTYGFTAERRRHAMAWMILLVALGRAGQGADPEHVARSAAAGDRFYDEALEQSADGADAPVLARARALPLALVGAERAAELTAWAVTLDVEQAAAYVLDWSRDA